MNSFAKFHEFKEASSGSPEVGQDEGRDAVLSELEKILSSRFFRSAERSQQFLRYVVERKLAGQAEQLKERTIGTEVFLRPQGYSTGEDSVVRVQAGEVRRRIERYYQAAENPPLRIELPVGSYSPVFVWATKPAKVESPVPTAHRFPSIAAPLPITEPARRLGKEISVFGVVCLASALALMFTFRTIHRASVPQPAHSSAIEQFWNPVFASQQPVVICIGASSLLPVGPSAEESGSSAPTDSYLGAPVRDVYAAIAISKLLDKLDKSSEVRIGSNCSLDDLRNAAAVSVGAYNNHLTSQLLANSHLALIHEKGQRMIRELAPGKRVWLAHIGSDGEGTDDFAVVSREQNAKTGLFAIAVVGTGPFGTQAASDFVSNPEYLEQGLRNVPADWPKKNLAIILETMGTDSVAGPPRIVATYFW